MLEEAEMDNFVFMKGMKISKDDVGAIKRLISMGIIKRVKDGIMVNPENALPWTRDDRCVLYLKRRYRSKHV